MLELEHGFRALDCNARLAPDAARAERGGPEDLERELHQAGVVRAAVAPLSRGVQGGDTADDRGYLRDNNAVARLSVDRPFLALARLGGPRDPRDTPAARLRNLTASRESHHVSPTEIEQFGYDDRFHGFLLAPAQDGLPDAETLDALAETEMPTLVRAGPGFPPSAVATAVLDRGVRTALLGFGGAPATTSTPARRSPCSTSTRSATSKPATSATGACWSGASASIPTASSSGAAPPSRTRTWA